MLVADDEPGVRRALERGLTAEGMDVVGAADGPSALRAALTGAFDVVLLDIMLPGLSGYRVLERLRAEGVRTPVLLVSAKDGEVDQADGLDLGADGYLVKPFSFRVLVAQVRALLRRSTADGLGRRLRIGELDVERAKRQVRWAGVAGAAEPAGVRRAGRAGRPGGRGGHQGRAAACRVGRRAGRHPQRRRGLRRLPAAQAGGGRRGRGAADRPRARLPGHDDRTGRGARRAGAADRGGRPLRSLRRWWLRRTMRSRITLVATTVTVLCLVAAGPVHQRPAGQPAAGRRRHATSAAPRRGVRRGLRRGGCRQRRR